MVPFGSVVFGRSRDTYVCRSTVNASGSTHMVRSFMGLTSSRDVTVVRTVSTRGAPGPTIFPTI